MLKKNSVRVESAGRMIGLGQKPSTGVLGEVMACPFPKVPVIEYVSWTIALPLTDSQIEATFGTELDILQSGKSVDGVAQVDSSFVLNGQLQVDMCVCGYGLHIFGEPLTFSQIGNGIADCVDGCSPTTPAAAPPISPDVFTAHDLTNGALTGVTGTTAPLSAAQIEWGFSDWNAGWHLAQAYKFQWKLFNRFLLIDELAADVAYMGPYAEASGMGTSDASVAQYAKEINKRYADLGMGSRFLPVSHRRMGSLNTAPTGSTFTGNTSLFRPTRDYDLAPVSWGGLNGKSSCGVPYNRLSKPLFLQRGVSIGIGLELQDQYHYDQMKRHMSVSEDTGTGAVANVQVSADFNGYTVGTGNAGLELTLDTGGNQVANTPTNTDRLLFKGGSMKVGLYIKGFEAWGDWSSYFCTNASQIQNYIDVPGVTGSIGGANVQMR